MLDILHGFGGWLHDVFILNWSSWTVLGMIGQICFTMRFAVQWLASEIAKKSVVPFAFWIFSLLGGGLLLVYSIYIKNPVFILGNGIGFCIYIRNIWLICNEKQRKKQQEMSETQ